MEKQSKIRLVGIVLAVILIGALGVKYYIDYKNSDDREVTSKDSLKFKEEYESLNGKTNENNNLKYLTVNISENNSVVYKTDKEILDVMENGTGVIYFGFNTCPWCRSLVETMLSSANFNSVANIYYVNVKDIRSSYEVQDKKLVKTKEGTDSYYEILNKLDKYLTKYTITSNKKEYDTKEKRLYAPTVVVVKDGEIVGFHEGTVDSQTNPYDGLNDEEKKELTNIFNEMFAKVNRSLCKDETGC